MGAVIVAFVAASFAVIVYCGYRDKVSDRDDFEQRRAARNAAVTARDMEAERWQLIQTAESIYVGENDEKVHRIQD